MLKTKFKFSDFHRDVETGYPWKLGNLFCNITGYCNQSCLYCHSPMGTDTEKEMPFPLIERLANQAAELGVHNFILTGGEPLLHTRFRQILELLATFPFEVKIATNGSILDEEMIDLLAENKVKSLQISLDTLNPEHYRTIKRNNNLDVLLANVKRIVKKGNLHLAISSVPNTIVAEDLDDILLFCLKEGVHTFTVMRPTPIHTGAANKSINLSEDRYIELLDHLIALYYGCTRTRLLELRCPYAKNSPLYRKWADKIDINLSLCECGRNALTISTDGRVSPCACLETEEFYFGDVRTSHLKDLWRHPSLDLFRGQARYPECEGCPDFSDCQAGCRALAFAETGRKDARDPFCTYWK